MSGKGLDPDNTEGRAEGHGPLHVECSPRVRGPHLQEMSNVGLTVLAVAVMALVVFAMRA
jgi:hypothetical protein